MNASFAPRSRLVGMLFVSAVLLHCGGDGHAPPPGTDAGGSAGTDGSGAGEAPSNAGDRATSGSASGGSAAGDNGAAGSPMSAAGAPSEASIPTFNGCTEADYVDLSDDDAERIILIAEEGLTFSPKCMSVAVSQTVTWQGSLSAHPLAPGTPVDAEAGSPGNPVPTTTSGSSVDVTFPTAGTYPYYCHLHGFGTGQGMVGVVHVRR